MAQRQASHGVRAEAGRLLAEKVIEGEMVGRRVDGARVTSVNEV
ncbi:hypothetical protein [Blastomonas sp. CCH3-A3]|nr:hypothetical protein [Blastomonas sp. CCH3-A3]